MSGAELDTFTTFGELLRHLRLRARLTQRELGLAVGYTDAHITRLENGQRLPDPSVVRARFIEALNLHSEPELAERLLELAAIANQGTVVTPKPATDQTASVLRTNLLAQLTSFIGREREIAQVQQLIAQHRLVTLTGAGGVGKTRLAIEVGTQCAALSASGFTHGVWLVGLAPLSDQGLLVQTVMSALDLKEEPGHTNLDVLTTYLTDKRLLLILDNCEHLIGACAGLAERLLSACPHLHILTTSREPLRVPGELVWSVPSLATPDPAKLPPLQQVRDYEAIALFVNRASAAQPEFTLTPGNVSAVAQICWRLGGIPLAIELAASRLPGLPVDEIASRLDDRFRLLTSGSRTALPRHQTLRTLIDWSYDLLSEPEQMLLQRLSVFAGGWTMEAAEMACSDEDGQVGDVLPLLLNLVSKSLVKMDKRGDKTHYSLLETIRLYALEKLAQYGELDAMHRRHAEAYLALAERAEPHLHTKERRHWFDWIEHEQDNFRAALAWSHNEIGDATMGLRLIGVLWPFWWWLGSTSEGGRWIEALLPALKADTPPTVRARALLAAGAIVMPSFSDPNSKEILQWTAWLEEALRQFRDLGDPQGTVYALGFLSDLASNQHDFARAQLLLEQGLAVARRMGNPSITTYVLRQLAWVAYDEHDLARVTALLEESLVLARKVDDEQEIAASLIFLSNVAFDQLDFSAAARFAQQALLAAQQAGARGNEHYALHQLGEAARFMGDIDRAKAFFEELYTLSLAEGEESQVESALHCLGKVAYDEGNYQQAQDLLIESVTVGRTKPVRFDQDRLTPFNLEWLASVAGAQGQPARAARLFGAAQAIRDIQHWPLPANCVAEYERHVAVARAQLDEAVFAAAWTEGKAMTPDQAVEYALDSQSVIHTQPN